MMNIVNGGSGLNLSNCIPRIHDLPVGATTFKEYSLRWVLEIFHNLKSILSKRGLETAVGVTKVTHS
ncbi:hypothetical protein ACV56Z_06880 [Staphylococcus aureus]